MDAGKFEIVSRYDDTIVRYSIDEPYSPSRPFSFHSIVRQTIFGSQIAADMKTQDLIVELDKVERITLSS
jgi:hypothetical protein